MLSKARIHSIAFKTKSWPLQFTPFSCQQRNTGNCLITNAIPKSGTYFINRIAEYLDKWEDTKIQINPDFWYTLPPQGDLGVFKCLPQFSVKKLRNGQMVAAHLPWSEHLEQVIENVSSTRRIKHVFLYRDPRDMLISYMRFVTYSAIYNQTPAARAKKKFFQENFSNDDDRLTYLIQERKDNYSVKYDFLKYEPWLRNRQSCAIKFEELYLEFLDIKENGFGNIFKKLFDYLEININTVNPINFYNCVYENSLTASGEKKKLSQYKRYFKDEHYKMLDNADFRKILDVFGYEW